MSIKLKKRIAELEATVAIYQRALRSCTCPPTGPGEPEKHTSCVISFSAEQRLGVPATFFYLKDGTKIVVRREGQRAWLEQLPQAMIRLDFCK